ACTCPRQGAPRGAPRRGAAGRGASGLPAVCVPLEVVHLLGAEGRDDLPAGLLHIRGSDLGGVDVAAHGGERGFGQERRAVRGGGVVQLGGQRGQIAVGGRRQGAPG